MKNTRAFVNPEINPQSQIANPSIHDSALSNTLTSLVGLHWPFGVAHSCWHQSQRW